MPAHINLCPAGAKKASVHKSGQVVTAILGFLTAAAQHQQTASMLVEHSILDFTAALADWLLSAQGAGKSPVWMLWPWKAATTSRTSDFWTKLPTAMTSSKEGLTSCTARRECSYVHTIQHLQQCLAVCVVMPSLLDVIGMGRPAAVTQGRKY